MSEADSTIQALRREIALQVSRTVARCSGSQTEIASRLKIPQPTLSKIKNGRVHDLSVELLLRVAIRAGLVLTLQTGRDSTEAGAFVSAIDRGSIRTNRSKLATEARNSLAAAERRLSRSERLEAFLQHNQLLAELQQAGRALRRRQEHDGPSIV